MQDERLEDPARRRFLQGAIALAAGAALPGCPNAREGGGSAEGPPNIVVILADDLGRELLGCYGNASVPTPHIDALAASGVLLEHCYATPKCHPSRAELMTGTYPFRMGFVRGESRRQDLRRYRRLPELLRNAGYRTGIFGKWHLGSQEAGDRFPDEFGFDDYCIWGRPDDPERHARYRNAIVRVPDGERVLAEDVYTPEFMVDAATDFVRSRSEQPFFLYYPSLLVHTPVHTPPQRPGMPASRGVSRLDDMLARLDAHVGELVAVTHREVSERDTLVVFTSDNGGLLRGGGGKGTLTDAGTRVPCLISWPGRLEAGRRSDALVDFSDFLPTLCEFAGCDPTEVGVGDERSLAAHLLDESGGPRQWVFSEWDSDSFIRERHWKLYSDGRLMAIGDDGRESPPATEAGDVARARARLARIAEDVQAGRSQVGSGA